MDDPKFVLKNQTHAILIMEVIYQTVCLFKARYYDENKKIVGNPHDLDVALYIRDCLMHVLAKDEFFELNYLSDNDYRKILNITYEMIFEDHNE